MKLPVIAPSVPRGLVRRHDRRAPSASVEMSHIKSFQFESVGGMKDPFDAAQADTYQDPSKAKGKGNVQNLTIDWAGNNPKVLSHAPLNICSCVNPNDPANSYYNICQQNESCYWIPFMNQCVCG